MNALRIAAGAALLLSVSLALAGAARAETALATGDRGTRLPWQANEWVPVASETVVAWRAGDAGPGVTLHGLFTTLGHYRSDSDFDRTARFYDRDGQSEGQVATFLRPSLQIEALGGLRVFYEVELGWNAWSRNAPDAWFPADEAYPVLKHREIWGEWRFSRADVALRAGYQHFADPSGLFLNHWGGAVAVDVGWGIDGRSGTRVLVGQLPDSTFEGVDVRENNFVQDSVFAGVANQWEFVPAVYLDAAAWYVGDFRAVDRPLHLGAIVVGVRQEADTFTGWAHVVAQAGVWEGAAAGGGDQTILAWAAQLGGRLRVGAWTLTANALFLSPDDDHDGNGRWGAFLGSSKNRSRTLWLTEDEFRDRYDNLDERIASAWGPFFANRAGLFVAELSVGYDVAPWYRPALVLAGSTNLAPANAMGHPWVGFEIDVVNVFPLADGVALFATGQVLLPGEGAAVFVNDVDRTATEIVGGIEAGFTAQF